MNEPGYIPISRKLFEHAIWNDGEPFSRGQAWIDLLALARFATDPGRKIVNGKWIEIKRGQMVASIRFLKNRWNWNSTRKVMNYLDLLESDGMLERQTEQGISIITICQYGTYNPIGEASGTPNGTAAEQKRNTSGTEAEQKRNKEKKEIKEKKDNKENKDLFGGDATPKKDRKKIVPPKPDWVTEYFKTKGANEKEALKFIDHHTARGWILTNGKKCRDWEAAARTWISNIGTFSAKTAESPQAKLKGMPKYGWDK